MKKKFLAFLLILFPIFSLGIAKAETIKIVSDTAYAPFEFKDSDQTYKGIDVDIINKVAEIKGWNIQMSYPGFDAAVNAVQAGQADAIMAGMTKTKEREKVFTMSDTYYDTISLSSLNSTDSSIETRVGDFNFKTLVFSDCLNQFHINTSVLVA